MPRVHQRSVAAHAPRFAALRRYNVQLAVGAHQLSVAAFHENNPAAIGGNLGKLLLISFCEAPAIGSGFPPFPSLKGIR